MIKHLALIITSALILSGCGRITGPLPANTPIPTAEILAATTPAPTATPSEAPAPTATPTQAPTPTQTPSYPLEGFGPDNFPEDVNPLTGLSVDEVSLLDRRPLAVKIQTFPRSQRPPMGVTQADIVFDYYQNAGLTRLIAIFYGKDAEQAGPIRSARLFDMSVIRMFKAIYGFGGADQRILTRLMSAEFAGRLVNGVARNCPPLCRIDPDGFNYLVANTAGLSEYADEHGINNDRQNLNGLLFKMEAPTEGQAVADIYTRYSISAYNLWQYEASSGKYLRYQDIDEDRGEGEKYGPLVDRENDEQITADNVVVLIVPHEYFQRPPHDIIEILLSGSGPAYAFRDGQAYEVVWNRPAQEGPLFLTFQDGTRYPFKPGNTWFQVIGGSSLVSQPEDGVYRFEFKFP